MVKKIFLFIYILHCEIKTVFKYKFSSLLLIIGPTLLVAIQYILWTYVYREYEYINGFTLENIILYVVIVRFWSFILPGFFLASSVEQRVKDGSIVKDLIQPNSIILF
ncbi:ABC-2 family transporter protein [Rothia sp. CCM 9419]|uniref:ABC-2 family transporter protein n=1 Tax=Rothia sp. CCM 9419 TaxID=3402662 RepID=UPI003AE6DC07